MFAGGSSEVSAGAHCPLGKSGLRTAEVPPIVLAAGSLHERIVDMPKLNERERLADLESRRRKLDDEVEIARRALRGKYAAAVPELAVERLTEREFREVVSHAIRAGGAASVAALKALPMPPAS